MLIERRFLAAATWMGVGAALAFVGFIHTGELTPAGGVLEIGLGTGWRWALGYALAGAFFALVHLWARGREPVDGH